MTELLAAAGAALAWFGVTLMTLSEARRGLALGLVLSGLGAGLAAQTLQGPVTSLALVAAGVLAGLLRLRDGAPGWGLLPAGSTPRIVVSLASLAASILVGATALSGAGAAARVAALAVGSIAGVRLLTASGRAPALAAASAMALAFGVLATPAAGLAAAFAAAALGVLPGAEGRQEGA